MNGYVLSVLTLLRKMAATAGIFARRLAIRRVRGNLIAVGP